MLLNSNNFAITESTFKKNLVQPAVFLSSSNDNLFSDSVTTDNSIDFYLDTSSTNNTLLNTTSSSNSVSSDSELIIKWYLDISSSPNGITLTDNLTEGQNILEEGNYTTTASKDGYANETINVTLNSSQQISFNLTDNEAPIISLLSPTNNYSTTDSTIFFEFNVSDNSNVYCELLLNNVSQYSSSIKGDNVFNTSLGTGDYFWAVYCNDSYSNEVTTNWSVFSIEAITTTTQTTEDTYSGGSCAYDSNYDWQCSDWGECIDGTQTRTCDTSNNCGNSYGRPTVERSCTETSTNESEETNPEETVEETPGFFSAITGAVIGGGMKGTIWVVVIVIILIVLWMIIRRKRKSSKKKSQSEKPAESQKKSTKKDDSKKTSKKKSKK
jgi:cytoskeletal protein RodZ